MRELQRKLAKKKFAPGTVDLLDAAIYISNKVLFTAVSRFVLEVLMDYGRICIDLYEIHV